jgi:hypothetical protein
MPRPTVRVLLWVARHLKGTAAHHSQMRRVISAILANFFELTPSLSPGYYVGRQALETLKMIVLAYFRAQDPSVFFAQIIVVGHRTGWH